MTASGRRYRLDFYTERRADLDRRPLGVDPRRRDRRRRRPRRSRAAGGARRGSSTGCSSGSATTPRSTATATIDEATAREAMTPDGDRRRGPRLDRPQAPRRDHPEVRLGPGRACQALAAVLAEEVETIEDVYEPFLLRLGFLDRTPQGRIATEAAAPAPRRPGLRDPAAAPSRTRRCRPCGTTCRRADRWRVRPRSAGRSWSSA